ncbi:MAG: hypothetical protein ACP5UN_02545 [Candidatus Micrarchaeia archaeon]
MVDTTNSNQQNMQSTQAQGSNQNTQIDIDPKIMYILAYLIPIIAGIIIFIIYGEKDKNLKFHSIQSIVYGIAIYIISYIIAVIVMFNYLLMFIPNIIVLLLWLYGLYIGYMAYSGKETPIPLLTDFLHKNIKI